MPMGVNEPFFLDTNVLVYAAVETAPYHEAVSVAFTLWSGYQADLWISRQILREYAAVLTRPQLFSKPVPTSTVIDQIAYYATLCNVADETAQVTENLLKLLETVPVGGKQVHDANIVATMQAYGIRQLLTHNVGDFARFSDFIDVVPLVDEISLLDPDDI